MRMNTVHLVGRVAGDPKFSPATETSKARLFLKLAVNRIKSEKADYIPIVLWGAPAVAGAEYIKKGKELGVVGSLQTNAIRKEDGTWSNFWEVKAQLISYGRDSQKVQAEEAEELPEANMESLATELLAAVRAAQKPASPKDTLIQHLMARGATEAEATSAAALFEQRAKKAEKAPPAPAPQPEVDDPFSMPAV